jgi:Antibiotic biosynthesis monooxygenase
MTTPSQKLTITVTQPTTLSTVIAVVPTEPDQLGDVVARIWRRAEVLSHAAGFVGTAIHHSLDGERVLEYSQWLSTSSWCEAMQRWSEREGDDTGRSDVRLYEVVLVFSASGSNVLEIAEPSSIIAMINVLSTDPSRRDQLMDVWRRGAERFWEKMPGAVAAALHRSEDGMRLVNYAQWTSGEAWQRARQEAFDNRAGMHGFGTSDPRLYQLDTIIRAATQPGTTE